MLKNPPKSAEIPEFSEIPEICQKLSKIVKNCQKLSKIDKIVQNCQKLSKIGKKWHFSSKKSNTINTT